MTNLILATAPASVLRIPLSPVYLLAYVVVAGFLYLVLALVLDLPLPGARRGTTTDDETPPVYHGRGAPKSRSSRDRPRRR